MNWMMKEDHSKLKERELDIMVNGVIGHTNPENQNKKAKHNYNFRATAQCTA